MKINITIGRDTLGDINTDADNEAFRAAVEDAITEEYPDAKISIEIGEHSKCTISGVTFDNDCNPSFDDREIGQRCDEIQNLIWNRADYI